MAKLETLQAISAGVVRNVIAENITIGNDPVYLGVWPRNVTTGVRADVYMIRAITGNIFMCMNANNSLMPFPGSIGTVAAKLFTGVEYVFPLSPSVNTLGFVAEGASINVEAYIRAFVVR